MACRMAAAALWPEPAACCIRWVIAIDPLVVSRTAGRHSRVIVIHTAHPVELDELRGAVAQRFSECVYMTDPCAYLC